MPVYTTTLPNGQSIRVMGPTGASPEAIQQAALQIAAQRTPALSPDSGERNYSLGTAASKGFSRGTERIKSAFGDVIPAMVGDALGFDEYAAKQMKEAQASQELVNRKYRAELQSYKDVQGIGDAIKFGIETVSEQIPNLATMVVPGIGAGQIARVGASKLAATELAKRQATAQGIGVYMGSYALNTPEVFQNIYDETGELATGTAILFGAAAAALDSVLPSAVLKNITPFQKSAIAASVLRKSGTRPGITKSVLTGIGKGSGAEGLTEAAQEAISISAENFVGNNPQIFNSEDWDRIMESAVRGAVAGGTFRGISEPFGRSRAEPKNVEDLTQSDVLDENIKIAATADVAKETAEENMKKAAPAAEDRQKFKEVANRLKISKQAAQALELGLEMDKDGSVYRFEPVDPQNKDAGEQRVNYQLINGLWEKQDESTPIDATDGIETSRGSNEVSIQSESTPAPPPSGESDRREVGVDTDTVPPTGGGENVSDAALSPENITAEQQWDEMSVSGVPFSELGKEDQLRLIEAQQEGELTGQLVDEIDIAAQDTFAGITFVKQENGEYERYKSKEGQINKRTGLPQGGPEYMEDFYRQAEMRPADDNLESRTDTEGTGQVYYRGTSEEFDDVGGTGGVIYLSPNRAEAEQVGGSIVTPYRLKVKNTFDINNKAHLKKVLAELSNEKPTFFKGRSYKNSQREIFKQALEDNPNFNFAPYEIIEEFAEDIEAAGFDSFFVQEQTGFATGAKNIGVFNASLLEPTQESRTDTEGTGQTAETVTTELVEEFGNNVNKTIEKGNLVIVDNVSQLPDNVTMSSTANGAYDPTTQTSYIVANRIQKGQARRVLLHEIGEHYGLEKMVGKDYMSLLNRLKTLRKQNADVDAIFAQVQEQYPELKVNSKPFLQEVMAKVGESAPNNTLFRRIVGAVKNFLRRLGLYNVNNFNDADIQDMILNSLRVSLAETTGTVTREQASGTPAVQMSEEEGPGAFKAAQEAATRLLGLPPDNTAMDRARAMGFDDKTYYHGTDADFISFKVTEGARNSNAYVSASPDPKVANHFAKLAGKYPTGAQVYPIKIRGNIFDIKNKQHMEDLRSTAVKEVLDSGGDLDLLFANLEEMDKGNTNWKVIEQPRIQKAMRKLGFDGFKSSELGNDVENIGIFNPANIRSINAAFNPENETSSNIQFSKEAPSIIDLGGVNVQESRAVMDAINPTIQNFKNADTAVGNFIFSNLSKIPDAAANLYVRFLSIPNKIELFGKKIPGLETILNALQGKANEIKQAREEVNGTIKIGQEILSRYSEEVQTEWNTILLELSRENVNPETIINDPEARAELERPVGKDNAGNQFYNDKAIDLVARYEQLPKDLRDLAKLLVSDLKLKYDTLLETMIATYPGAEAQLRERFASLDYYLPMVRKGNFWFKYIDKNGEEASSSAETSFLRERMKKKLAEEGAKKFEDFTQAQLAAVSGRAPSEFVENLKAVFETSELDAGVKQSIVDTIEDQYLALFPEQSLRNQESHRRGVPGYINDVLFAYGETAPKIIASTANARYNTEIVAAANQVSSETKDSTSAIVRAIGKDTINTTPFYLNPVANIFASMPAYLSYVWFIGGNISSAFVNLTQLPLIVLPFLQGEYGFDESQKALFDAIKMYSNGGFEENRDFLPDRTMAPFKKGKNGKRIYRDKEFAPNGKYHQLFKDAEEAAALRRGVGYEITELRKSLGAQVKSGAQWQTKAEAAVGYVFQNSERLNREVTLIAAFNLAKSKGMADKDAIQKAIDLTSKVHSHALPEVGPSLFQDGLGKVTFVFKRFAQAQVYLVSKLFKDVFATKPKTEKERKERDIARNQLLGVYGYSFLMAGVQGMPFYGGATILASLLFDDEDDPFDPHTAVNQAIGNIAYRGPLSAVLGVDISQRTGFRDLVFREDPARLEKIGASAYMLEVIGGPGYSIVRRGFEGAEMLANGEIGRGAERILPTAVGNALKTVRYNTDGMTNRYGAPIIEGNPSVYESFMQILGFSNIELSEAYTEGNALKGPERKLQKRRSQLLLQYFLAKQTGDVSGMKSIQKDINRFNSKAPRSFKLTPSVMNKSFKARTEKAKKSVQGIYISSKRRADLEDKYLPD